MFTVFQVNVHENIKAGTHAGIYRLPTFKIYKGGKVLDTVEGASEAESKLRDIISKCK